MRASTIWVVATGHFCREGLLLIWMGGPCGAKGSMERKHSGVLSRAGKTEGRQMAAGPCFSGREKQGEISGWTAAESVALCCVNPETPMKPPKSPTYVAITPIRSIIVSFVVLKVQSFRPQLQATSSRIVKNGIILVWKLCLGSLVQHKPLSHP